MPIQNWSPTPADNASVGNINMQTGSAPSTVHPSVRQLMADVATWYAGAEWLTQADVPTYASGTSFTVPGNRTAAYTTGRRVLATGTTGAGYTVTGTITSSAYTTLTTVNVSWDSGSIDSTLDQVALGILQDQLAHLVPAGTLIDFAGTSAPAGYLACDGSAISRTTYAALFAAIGTTWGAGDGSTTFNVPNLQRRATIGAGGTAVSGPANTVGATGGEETHTLSTPEMPSHTHTDAGHGHGVNDAGHQHTVNSNVYNATSASGNTFQAGSSYNLQIANSPTTTATTGISIQAGNAAIQNTGGGGAHNNMQPSAVVLKCIKY